jgi:hypothetical protein
MGEVELHDDLIGRVLRELGLQATRACAIFIVVM